MPKKKSFVPNPIFELYLSREKSSKKSGAVYRNITFQLYLCVQTNNFVHTSVWQKPKLSNMVEKRELYSSVIDSGNIEGAHEKCNDEIEIQLKHAWCVYKVLTLQVHNGVFIDTTPRREPFGRVRAHVHTKRQPWPSTTVDKIETIARTIGLTVETISH